MVEDRKAHARRVPRGCPLIDQLLLDILACPRCESRPPVKMVGTFLVCTVCDYAYRIIDCIPDMLVEDAVAPEDWKAEVERNDG